ncbi:response regulator [Novosphingobium sp.]|uniref:response regulator n=1 Tax=Novosphingobium sp. TaxID=1874826 RepID=UPI003BA87ED2
MLEQQQPAPAAADTAVLPSRESGVDGVRADPVLRFRRFTVLPNARQLLADGAPIELGSRAFDLLVVLLRSQGQIVTKAEIFSHVWPSTTVEESNLRFQMATLRTALGDDRDVIKTIPGRGYLLIAEPFPDMQVVHAPATAPACGVPAGSARSRTVAIIDDDLGVREALEGLLLSAGIAAESYGSVQEFRDRPSPQQPACLVLDVWLPGMSGIDFNSELVRDGTQPPVIFISGHADVHTSVRAMKAGAREFLTKPVRHQDLLDAIQEAIGE